MDISEAFLINTCNSLLNPDLRENVISLIMENYDAETRTYNFANCMLISKEFMDELIENPEYYKSIFMQNIEGNKVKISKKPNTHKTNEKLILEINKSFNE